MEDPMPKQSVCQVEIVVRDVLKERYGDHIYIVLKTGKGSRWTHLIDIEHTSTSAALRKAAPFKIKTDELHLRLSEKCDPSVALEKVEKLPCNVSERRRVLPFAPSRRSPRYKEIADDPIK